jgi:DnaJ family protein C protein 3
MEWHPDKYQGDDLQKSEKRMADINAAYEVLSNDGKIIA